MKQLTPLVLALPALALAAGDPPLYMTVLREPAPPSPLLVSEGGPYDPPIHMTVLSGRGGDHPVRRSPSTGWRFDYAAGMGYRRDRLEWNVGLADGPDVLTEAKWRNLDTFQISGEAHIVTPARITFQAQAAYGWVLGGNHRRSDYLEDGRRGEFSRTTADADGGHFLDLSGGVGYRFQPREGKVRPYIEPLAGYTYREYTLDADNFRQAVATDGLTPPEGPLGGAKYRYRGKWHGPWAGLRLGIEGERWQLFGQGAYHFLWYRAEGRWKSLADAQRDVRFRHEADGRGITAEVGGSYRLWRALSLRLAVNFHHWQTDGHGDDITTSGGGGKIKSRLNEVRWRTLGGTLNLSYDF